MATDLQVTFDCADPHAQARFWAAALGYTEEDHSALVEQLLADGVLPERAAITKQGKRAFAEVAACSASGKPRLFFQRVPEPKTAKNRMHLDLHVGPDRMEQEVARLKDLGASEAWRSSDRGGPCVTMRDPEGNEFCVG